MKIGSKTKKEETEKVRLNKNDLKKIYCVIKS